MNMFAIAINNITREAQLPTPKGRFVTYLTEEDVDPPLTTTRICITCCIEKPLADFSRMGLRGIDQVRRSECKICNRKAQRMAYKVKNIVADATRTLKRRNDRITKLKRELAALEAL